MVLACIHAHIDTCMLIQCLLYLHLKYVYIYIHAASLILKYFKFVNIHEPIKVKQHCGVEVAGLRI